MPNGPSFLSLHRQSPIILQSVANTLLWGLWLLMLCGIDIQESKASMNDQRNIAPYFIPIVTPSPFLHTQPRSKLPEEPDEFDQREVDAFYDWRNDMFFRRFDMTGMGTVDFMTARRTYKVWLDDYGTPSVITVADPLFYWMDLNGNGRFEQELGEMWLDSYEDGLTGNEKPYDNSDLQQAPTNIPSWSAPTPKPQIED